MEKEVRRFAKKNQDIIEKLMKNPELLTEVNQIAGIRENGVSQDVKDLIAGLKCMTDIGGCYNPLEKLDILSTVIDEVMDFSYGPGDISISFT